MPSFNVEVPNPHSRETAVERLKGFVTRVRDHFKDQVSDFQETWVDNVLNFSFKTYGFLISGTLTVDDQKARLDGNLPFAAMAFRGKIEQTIRENLEKALA
jgi:hypothetical protein